jgi:arsenate reductase (thioredoxin)
MAEGFARAYGSDVLTAQSAGLAPAMGVAPMTCRAMLEKNIDLSYYFTKQIEDIEGGIDLIVNMSGHDLPAHTNIPVEVWEVRDPIGESEEVFRQVRDEIEQRVLQLIERLRSRKPPGSEGLPSTPEVDTRRRPTRQ